MASLLLLLRAQIDAVSDVTSGDSKEVARLGLEGVGQLRPDSELRASALGVLRLLIAEDSDDLRRLMRLMVEKLGHLCDGAPDGLLLLDLNMPRMSGSDAASGYARPRTSRHDRGRQRRRHSSRLSHQPRRSRSHRSAAPALPPIRTPSQEETR